jgi:Uma2 family endonuclease
LPNDGFRYEVLDGVLHVMPPPSFEHRNTLFNLAMWMRLFARTNDLGIVVGAPIGVRLPGQEVPLEPDIVFISKQRAHIIGTHYIEGVPDLIVEILSPSNWVYDRKTKQEVYRTAGVQEYWLVDYRLKLIDVLLLEDAEYVLQGQYGMGDEASSSVLAGFKVAVADVFAR